MSSRMLMFCTPMFGTSMFCKLMAAGTVAMLLLVSPAGAQSTSGSLRLWEQCVEQQVIALDKGQSVAELARAATANCRHVVELADIRGDLPNERVDGAAIVRRIRAKRR